MMVVDQPLTDILARDLASGLEPYRFNLAGSHRRPELIQRLCGRLGVERLYGKPPRLYPDSLWFSWG